jgi:hypothetical protein
VAEIPKLGLATGFGVIAFGIAFIVSGRWFEQNINLDIGIGAVVGGIAWLIMIATGWPKK